MDAEGGSQAAVSQMGMKSLQNQATAGWWQSYRPASSDWATCKCKCLVAVHIRLVAQGSFCTDIHLQFRCCAWIINLLISKITHF